MGHRVIIKGLQVLHPDQDPPAEPVLQFLHQVVLDRNDMGIPLQPVHRPDLVNVPVHHFFQVPAQLLLRLEFTAQGKKLRPFGRNPDYLDGADRPDAAAVLFRPVYPAVGTFADFLRNMPVLPCMGQFQFTHKLSPVSSRRCQRHIPPLAVDRKPVKLFLKPDIIVGRSDLHRQEERHVRFCEGFGYFRDKVAQHKPVITGRAADCLG